MKNFLLRRRATFDPPRFQGWGRSSNYFEGWYVKVVIPEKNLAYAFIPGISYGADGAGHAFLQVLDGVAATSAYHRYPIEDFTASTTSFSIALGPHRFSDKELRVQLEGLEVDLTFKRVQVWQKKALAPGVMGWYGFVPRMQCYHGLVSLHHELEGYISVNNGKQEAAGGVGYIEKDWGSGFPDAWIWCQSNHLTGTSQAVSLMASVASIPWMGSSFTGFLATFLFEGELHYFTTWARSQVQAKVDESNAFTISFYQEGKHLRISGRPAPGGELLSPVTGQAMTGKINESLRGELDVVFYCEGQKLYAGKATWAGVEVSPRAGDLLQTEEINYPWPEE
ncbi:tocopherol cyclase family protein [Neolewinella agarilytica]|uniref:tocopherol cyclase family protein n=1 Tax=Neolewinella agarilytica TaxID=478744 RepID=UPI002353BE4A|nr:tocopherol cyclase family protein [Neolewinella agarilytica]